MPSLNLGSGEHGYLATVENGAGERLTDWVNVDRYSLPAWSKPPDYVANVLEGLPFEDSYFDRCYMGHFLEHLEYEAEIPIALAEVWRVCKDGAKIRVVGPCADKTRARGHDVSLLRIMAPKTGGRPGEHHRWWPTTAATLLAVQAFDPNAQEIDVGAVFMPDWPNPAPSLDWQCAIAAVVRK